MNSFAWNDAVSASVISRPNGGPGAARNTGLEQLPSQAEAVAFLDSDDRWMPQHLHRAKRALEAGADVYFDDHLGVGGSLTHFQCLAQEAGEDVEGLPTALTMSLDRGPGIESSPAGEDLWEFRPGQAALTFAQAYVAQTSTIVVSPRLADRRFEPRLRRAGEDYFYIFELARIGARIAYSTLLGCRQGEGINHYGSAILTGGPRYLELLRDNVLCMIMMRKDTKSDTALDAVLKRRIAERAADFVMYWLRLLLTRGHVSFGPIAAVVRYDSLVLLKAASAALRRAFSKINRTRPSAAARRSTAPNVHGVSPQSSTPPSYTAPSGSRTSRFSTSRTARSQRVIEQDGAERRRRDAAQRESADR